MSQPTEILIVDDYDADALLLQLMLKRNGVANPMYILEDGRAALDFILGISTKPFSGVVIMDIRLPKLDGLDVLRRLRQNPETRQLPVIITSGVIERERDAALHLGANACLAKPIRFETLRTVLDGCGFVWNFTDKESK